MRFKSIWDDSSNGGVQRRFDLLFYLQDETVALHNPRSEKRNSGRDEGSVRKRGSSCKLAWVLFDAGSAVQNPQKMLGGVILYRGDVTCIFQPCSSRLEKFTMLRDRASSSLHFAGDERRRDLTRAHSRTRGVRREQPSALNCTKRQTSRALRVVSHHPPWPSSPLTLPACNATQPVGIRAAPTPSKRLEIPGQSNGR